MRQAIGFGFGVAVILGTSAARSQTPSDAAAQAGGTASTTPPSVAATRPDDGSASTLLGDIVVTARRRDESLFKVPIAITALSGEALASRSIRSEADLQSAVPGLLVRESGGSNNFNYAIRGQSIDPYTSSPAAVLAYVNEVQLLSYSASSFFDLENIQVLKGPQGTLFGRNTTGGAILYQTAVPGRTESGFFTLRAGNFGARQATVAATRPLAEGLSLRLAGNFTDGGAYVRNLFDGRRVGDNLNKAVRATLRFDRGGIRSTLTAQYGTDRGTNVPTVVYNVNACGGRGPTGLPLVSAAACLLSPGVPAFDAIARANPGLPAGGIADALALQRARGPWVADVNSSLTHSAETWFVTNKSELDLGGGLTIKNIAGYSRSSKNDRYDFDGSPFGIYENREDTPLGQAQATRQVSEELQLQGRVLDDRLTFVVGGFYSDQRDTLVSQGKFFDLPPVVPATIVPYSFVNVDRSIAGFAQATYALTRTLNLTGGFRYSQDRITGRNRPTSVYGPSRQRIRNSKPSWTASIDWQAAPTLLLYVTQRGSWRAGGINFTAFPLDATAAGGGNLFLPETTRDVEVGAKYNGRLCGVPVTLAVDAYDQWVDDVQRANNQIIGGNPALYTLNVPGAEIRGFEASATVRPARWLDLGASGSYTDARFTRPDTFANGVAVSYGPFADVPKWSGAAYAQLSAPFAGDAGTLTLRGDVYAQTGVYFSNLAGTVAPGTRLPSYALLNARLGWDRLLGLPLAAALYARNLTDERYFTGGLPTGTGFGVDTASPGRPRSYGAELRFTF